MSLEQNILALTAAIEANTAALLGGAKATPAAAAAAPEKAATPEKAAKATKPAKAAYEAQHTKSEAQAAVNEVKEKLGVAVAKGIIKKAGGDKLADLTTDEQFDKLYDLSKEALGGEDGEDGEGEGI